MELLSQLVKALLLEFGHLGNFTLNSDFTKMCAAPRQALCRFQKRNWTSIAIWQQNSKLMSCLVRLPSDSDLGLVKWVICTTLMPA